MAQPNSPIAPLDDLDTRPEVLLSGPVTAVDVDPQSAAHTTAIGPALEVGLHWRGRLIAYRLFRRPRRVRVGPHKRATLVTPAVMMKASRFTLLRPRAGGARLRLAPGMRGQINLATNGTSAPTSIESLLAAAPTGRFQRHLRAVDLQPGDRARVVLNTLGDLHVDIRFVAEPEVVPRPRNSEPLLRKITIWCSLLAALFAGVATQLWGENPPRQIAINNERLTKIQAPLEREKRWEARRAAAEAAKKEKEAAEEAENAKKAGEQKKEAENEGQSKRAKEKAGKLGHADAPARDTVITKGDKDVLREKVSKVGLLGLIGKERQQGSGLSKLFAESNDIEQAVAGMTGAKVAAGRGSHGLSTSGAGTGGGGTGFGHIYGSGNLDTGGRGGKGQGRGPKLGDRGEREVKVSMSTGDGETDGSLSKDQIERVVRAHAAGIKYCYEKELQRKQSLSGNVDMFWVIGPDGSVQKASVKASSLSDAAVEGCIIRQVKQWQFPKAAGQTIVGRYPFLFKGGH
ncbi:MAG TPA: AgmX/PglI C-terminal domain-containing protein [Polyangia bacterium]|nr:AgmX/PglI C-terminal domain-containing protein [Polyangia bacterium]